MPSFAFTGAPGQQQGPDLGAAQYAQQGQASINPGQAQVAQSSPVSMAGMQNLAKALQAQGQPGPTNPQQPSITPEAGVNALGMGAQMNPNQNGMNMGGVGPTQQNSMLAQGMTAAAQNPGVAQNLPYQPIQTPNMAGMQDAQNMQMLQSPNNMINPANNFNMMNTPGTY